MARVAVIILHPEPGPSAGPLTHALGDARAALAERHRAGFLAAGADSVTVVAGPPDDIPFGARLRGLLPAVVGRWRALADAGVVVLGSGAMPLATAEDRRRFVAVAASGDRRALTNGRFSADAVAVGRAAALADLPDLDADNALPRWLEEVAAFTVAEASPGQRLRFDLDSPLDVALLADLPAAPSDLRRSGERQLAEAPGLARALRGVRSVMRDRRAELLVAGRTSASALRYLERAAACRVRALVEERGMRAASRLAQAEPDDEPTGHPGGHARSSHRPPASVLGMVLDEAGPGALGRVLATLGDAALIDSRVLLAHRLGADESAWPSAEDRYAADLLRPEWVADPWLRSLTAAAVDAPLPVILGGHSLVGPGLPLLARSGR